MGKSISNITLPLFPIADEVILEPLGRGTVVYTHNDGGTILPLYIDDKEAQGSTLGERRLSILVSGRKLFPLSRAIYSLRDLIKRGSSLYIDTNGEIFRYRKSEFYEVHYHKIKDFRSYTADTILLVENLHCPILADRPPQGGEDHVGLIYIDRGYLLYDFSEGFRESYRRKI